MVFELTRPELAAPLFAGWEETIMILECLERGWYPSWDAQNPGSVQLAEKLGYHYDHGYTAYEIRGY